jgi:pimeloyl-ACP methyl ester carboxylesterase
VLAGGQDSDGSPLLRPAAVLAERLGRPLVRFPGGHVGVTEQPEAFADRLAEVIALHAG